MGRVKDEERRSSSLLCLYLPHLYSVGIPQQVQDVRDNSTQNWTEVPPARINLRVTNSSSCTFSVVYVCFSFTTLKTILIG
jgi:hypothetical protein